MKLAYLLSRYPAVSHTFFLQEVVGLRAEGLEIHTASINPPDRPAAQFSPDEQHAVATTFYVKQGSSLTLALTALRIALLHPGVALRGVRAVFRLARLTLHGRLLWLLYLGEALLVGDWMRRNQLQHLHVHFGGPVASVGMLTSIAWQVPYSLTIHGPEELQNFDSNHLVEKATAACFIVCISDFCRSQLMQKLPVTKWPRCIVNRLGVSSDLFERNLPPAEDNTVTVVCTGRLVPEKAQHLLLEAAAHVMMQGLPLRVRLIGHGPDRASLEALADRLNIRNGVEFLGALPHAETLRQLESADIFALVSFAEGIPVAIMEAMALGLPCISTGITGIPELIQNGVDGILVPPSNLDALIAALQRLASDASLRKQLGTAARQKVQREYSLATNHKKLAGLLREQVARCGTETAQ